LQKKIELSVVEPCLNEADTLSICLDKYSRILKEHGITGEIIVADNGSTDGSPAIGEKCGARVIHVRERGYGKTLMGGIAAARGRFILMGDAGDSYDFFEIPKFLEKLRAGHDLVQGCRLPAGGGKVLAGAMPFSHRWIGNPALSRLPRGWFRVPIHDIYCGTRAFRVNSMTASIIPTQCGAYHSTAMRFPYPLPRLRGCSGRQDSGYCAQISCLSFRMFCDRSDGLNHGPSRSRSVRSTRFWP
jgi:glycosyltransferase involved in cell wall biosynthesis